MSKVTKIVIFSLLGLVFALYFYFKGKWSNGGAKSSDSVINNAIDTIDSSIDKWYYFNVDHIPIFDVLKVLSKGQIIRLHKDFGVRYHNSVNGRYTIIQLFEGFGAGRKYSLTGILQKEFDSNQLSLLKDIYKSKGLSFPLVN